MRFVTQKPEAQLDLQTLHRVRERTVIARTALTNQLRAILLERGLTFPKGRRTLMRCLQLPVELNGLSARIQQLVADISAESAELDKRIEALNDELAEVARRDEPARRLATIPGVSSMRPYWLLPSAMAALTAEIRSEGGARFTIVLPALGQVLPAVRIAA